MVSYLDVVKKVDSVPYPHEQEYGQLRENVFTLTSHNGFFQLGYLIQPVVEALKEYPQYFKISIEDKTVKFNSNLDTIESRENALSIIGNNWKSKSIFKTLEGWRNEKYTIYSNDKENNLKIPYFKLERAMCPLFGVVMYGVHINGFVRTLDGEIKLWVPRRAANKPTYPGMLDNMVAGGIGYPYSPLETCYKECYEEAGLDQEYVSKKIKSCGVVSYLYQLHAKDYSSEAGLIQPEVEYIYDIEMDESIIPHPVDHESENFRLLTIQDVKEKLLNGEFKDNCAAIIIDFMIRHSIITPDNEFEFIEINNRLHRFLPFPVKSN